jgi:hypothetical protein
MTDDQEPAGDEREPTEDELIDFMDWLIDNKLPDEQIDMSRIEVTSDPMEKFSEDSLGPATGEDTLPDYENPDVTRPIRWWAGAVYVVDLGDVRLLYRP